MQSVAAAIDASLNHLRQSLSSTSARFRRDRGGIAAVEFAFVLPLMLLMYLGCYDVSQEIMANHKANAASGTVDELVGAQSPGSQIPTAVISGIVGAAGATMAPFPSSNLTTTVSAIDLKLDSSGTCCVATVNWSYTQGGTLRPCNQVLTQTDPGAPPSLLTIPKAVASPSANVQSSLNEVSVIVTDVSYTYTPVGPGFDYLLPRAFQQTTYSYPRMAGQVLLQNPVNPPSGQNGTVC